MCQGGRVRRVAPGFNGQPGVVNGASDLFGEVFGDAGVHARSAVGVSELPLDAPVEVELIVEVRASVRSSEDEPSRSSIPAYGQLRRVTDTASVLLCDNPGLMTLDGTNTWVLQRAGQRRDGRSSTPGPTTTPTSTGSRALGTIRAGTDQPQARRPHRRASTSWSTAPVRSVRAVGSGFLRGLGGPLSDGEVIDAAGLRITVMATPGHTADSLSFLLDGAVLTADTVLGRGTTVIDSEDGSLRDYLESLRRLHGLGRRGGAARRTARISPTSRPSPQMYLAHREERLDQVRDALRVLGEDATARQIVEHVYTDVDEKLWPHAEKSTCRRS